MIDFCRLMLSGLSTPTPSLMSCYTTSGQITLRTFGHAACTIGAELFRPVLYGHLACGISPLGHSGLGLCLGGNRRCLPELPKQLIEVPGILRWHYRYSWLLLASTCPQASTPRSLCR